MKLLEKALGNCCYFFKLKTNLNLNGRNGRNGRMELGRNGFLGVTTISKQTIVAKLCNHFMDALITAAQESSSTNNAIWEMKENRQFVL